MMNSRMMSSRGVRRPEIFLNPGDYFCIDVPGQRTSFNQEPYVVKTVLGSCVSISFWNPVYKLGAICHYRLPSRKGLEVNMQLGNQDDLLGDYADEVIRLFHKRFKIKGMQAKDMRVGVFGGSKMYPVNSSGASKSIGENNIKAAFQLLEKYGYDVTFESIGGEISRRLVFDLASGEITIKKVYQ